MIEQDATLFPDSKRSVNAGGEMFSLLSDQAEGTTPSLISIVAYEFGHTLWSPHSYRFDPGEYDNPMDIMNDAEAAPGLQVGTIAINRYAAGWIDQDEVEVYSGDGKFRYVLAPPGDDGTQMLVLQSGDSGFITLGTRVKKGYDAGCPRKVSSPITSAPRHQTVINRAGGSPGHVPCFGLIRPTQAVLADLTVPLDYHDVVGHVMEVGDGYTYGGISVKVVERRGDTFVVEVAEEPLDITVIGDGGSPPTNSEPLKGFYEEAYGADPLGLIAGYDVTTTYTLDNDFWEVWICKAPDGYLDISPEDAISVLESKLVPYFQQLSGGLYRPVFRAGGSVQITSEGDPDYGKCDSVVGEAIRNRVSGTEPEGVVLIVDKFAFTSIGGLGDKDRRQFSVLALYDLTFPENNRDVHLSGTVLATPDIIDTDAVPDWALPYLTEDRLQFFCDGSS